MAAIGSWGNVQPEAVENQEKGGEGICIASIDGGGPGSMSQLRIIDEFMSRLAFKLDVDPSNLIPANFFDLMGGVGFGGLVAVLLGRLRLTTKQAMEELYVIGTETFPKCDSTSNSDLNMKRLRGAIESMLQRQGHPVDIKLRDASRTRCKVVLFAARAAVVDTCQLFRTYRSPYGGCLDFTIVEALCAVMATPELFSSVTIGPSWLKQRFAGIPHGLVNPTRAVLKESLVIFGENVKVSLVLSLGSGQRTRLSDLDHHVPQLSHIHCDATERDLSHQLYGFFAYLRLSVDRGIEQFEPDDWQQLGLIVTHTNIYLERTQITQFIDQAFLWILQRNGSVTLGQLNGTNADSELTLHSETLRDYLVMEFKQMHDIVQQMGIAKIILVDAIGNTIPIPRIFCPTYAILLDVIGVYFKHQKPPGSSFVKRGDYRLVHGSRRRIMGPVEWDRIEKAELIVEMSMVLHTHNGDEARCPRCQAWFEGQVINGWAQCLSCSGHFQIETRHQAEPHLEPDDEFPSASEEEMEISIVSPASADSQSNTRCQPPMRGPKDIGTDEELIFRLISVINFLERNRNMSSMANTTDTSSSTAVLPISSDVIEEVSPYPLPPPPVEPSSASASPSYNSPQKHGQEQGYSCISNEQKTLTERSSHLPLPQPPTISIPVPIDSTPRLSNETTRTATQLRRISALDQAISAIAENEHESSDDEEHIFAPYSVPLGDGYPARIRSPMVFNNPSNPIEVSDLNAPLMHLGNPRQIQESVLMDWTEDSEQPVRQHPSIEPAGCSWDTSPRSPPSHRMHATDEDACVASMPSLPAPLHAEKPTAQMLSPHDVGIRLTIEMLLNRHLWSQTEIPFEVVNSFNVASGDPGFRCPLYNNKRPCNKQEVRMDRFKHHLQQHLGIKPYSCAERASPELACERRFSSIASRSTHLKNKTLVTCDCGVSVLPKNMPRHYSRCPARQGGQA